MLGSIGTAEMKINRLINQLSLCALSRTKMLMRDLNKVVQYCAVRWVAISRRRSGPDVVASRERRRVTSMSDDGVLRDKYDFERQQREMISTLVRLAVPLWKAQMRLQKDGDERTSIRAALRHLQSASSVLEASGIEIGDYKGQQYDPGMSPLIAPVAFEEHPTCSSETVIETIAPAVSYRGQIICKSEAVIGVPLRVSNPPNRDELAGGNAAPAVEGHAPDVGTGGISVSSDQATGSSEMS
jgi:hypothetical protein